MYEHSCLCVCVRAYFCFCELLGFFSDNFCVSGYVFVWVFVSMRPCILFVCINVCISLCVCVFIGLFACLCACVRVRRLSSRDVCAAQQGFISHGMRLEMSLYAQRPPKGVAKLRTKFAWCHFSSPKALRPSGRVCCPFYQSLQFFPATRRRCDKWHERLRAR